MITEPSAADVGSELPETGATEIFSEIFEPLHVDDTDYLNLFWSGKDTLHLSRSLVGPSLSSAAHTAQIPRTDKALMDQLQPAPRVRPGKKPRHAARVPPRAPPPVPSPRVLPALRPRNEKPPRLLTEEEILERMEILSRPTTDKTEEDMLPPPLCTEGPQLSFSGVDELHERSVEGSCEFEAIPAHVRSVILNVTSITSGSEEWEVTNRQAFPDAFFSRKDLFYTVDGTNSVERTSAARSALFSKVDYRKVPRHFMDYNGFMHRYCLGFVCLVFDMRLQVIGTYDMQLGAVLPGITICPLRKVTEKVRKSASLLRIDFSALPRNVFAIAPVLFDQAGHPLPALGLSLGLSACGPDVDDWTALSERMKAFIGVRISGDTMDNKLNELIGSSAVKTEFGKGCGYSPFVIFRRSTVEKGWGLKSLHLMIHGCMTSDVISALVRGLHTAGVLPYHLIHIEHCCDCENHAMTTWHIPESYEKRVSEVKRALKSYIPPTLVYSNTLRRLPGDEKTTDNHMARIGAFEVVLRPYFSTLSMSVYSKLNQKVMPQVSDIIDVCSSVVLPEKLQYSRKRIVYVSLFDSYYRTIAKDSRIILFKVNTHHNTTSDALENLVDLKEVQAYSGIRSAISTSVMTDNLDNVAPLPRSVVVSGRVRPASAGSPNKSRGTLPRSPKREQTNQAHDNKRLPPKKSALEERKPTFSEELMKSEAVQDYIFRHSLAYYRVRCWSHFEVDLWLKSHGVSDQAISNAHASGVEDGASLLALANKVTLRKWGVRAQLTLKKLEASLISIRSSAADFDPVIIEGLPEDGQEKRGYSRASADYISGGTRKNPLFEQYAVSNLSADGSIQFEISVAGTYVLMATSPSTATFCSYAFSCGSSMQYNYTALLKPITVPVYFRILMDDVGSKLLDGVPFATNGLLFSVVNMGCGKRHTGFVNFEEVFEETLTEDGEEPPPSLAVRPPKLQRYNSIVNVLSVNPAANSISRSQSAGVLPSNAGQKHFARAKKRVDTKKTKQRVATSLIWLPIGKYYSEVDGSVFYVKDNDHLKFIRETAPADLMGTTPVETTVADRLIFGGEVREPAIVKCHMRLVKNSIRGFQMIYRRYKKTFLFDKMCAYMVMRRGAKRFCDWARNEVRQKKIIKLQSWLRMTKVLREYKHFWASTVFIQTRLRIVLARLRLRKMKKARKVIYKYIASWYFRLKMKQHTAALIIQMMFRRAAAIKKKDCLIFAKRCKKLFVRYIGRIKAKIRMVNAAKVARGREQDECMFMAREEQHVLKHLQWLKAEQRRLIELRLKAIAKKRDAAATKIQASCRGPLLRMRRHRGIHALIRLQRILRVKIYISRKMSGQKLRYLFGFKSLLQHPQLLGGTMLLLSIWSSPVILPKEKGADSTRPAKKNLSYSTAAAPIGTLAASSDVGVAECNEIEVTNTGDFVEAVYEQSTQVLDAKTVQTSQMQLDPLISQVSFTSSTPQVPQKSDMPQITFQSSMSQQFSFSAYSKYLTRPAIKIQSVIRMARIRFEYVSSQKSIKGRYPHLYRHLKPVSTQEHAAPRLQSNIPVDSAEHQAAVKLQAVARRFSVRHKISMSRLPLSTKCNDPLSARSVEATAVVASVGDGHEEFFPGYYNAKGVYIYYQSDNGNDYFGYYDDDGVYSYCEGDITKVMFSPILAEVETKTDAGKATDSLLYVIDADNRDKVYVKHNLLEEDEENFIEDVNKFSHRFELKRSDQDVSVNDALRRDTDAKITLKREKSVTFLQEDKAKTKSMGKKGSKKDMVNLDDLDVDAVVNHADDLSDEVGPSLGRQTDASTRDNNERVLRRPWSFISEISEDNNTTQPNTAMFPRVLSFASGLTAATDMSGIRSISESVKDVLSATSKAISLKSSSMKHKAGILTGELSDNITAATTNMKATAEKVKLEKERLLRIKNHKFQVEDAVLTVRGTAMSDIPRLNRQWFIGVFPHTTDIMAEEGDDKTGHVRDRQRDQQEYEMRHGRNIGEATRSAMLYPLSKEAFQKLIFSLQLADLPRYVVVDVCLFVEADEGALIRPDYLPSNVSVPAFEQKLISKDMSTKTWLPAFRGEFRLDEGAVFGPCGGKVNVLLRPNLSEAIYLSRAQARRLSVLEGLTVSVSLQPIAIPSMEFILSLRDNTPPPFFPGHTIDAVLLQKYNSSYTFNGAAVCAASFHDRMLVSARHKGAPLGLLEFNKNGECIGRITNHLETLKTVICMIVGAKHVLLCTNGGMMGMIRPRKSGEVWSAPLYVEVHSSTVIMGIAMHRAGIDFFFTVDKYCNIAVTIFENSRLLKSYLNTAFANSTICSLSACCNSLYIGQTDGILLVLDVTELIDGDFKVGSMLKEKFIYCGEIFANKTSITSLGVLATNAFFSLPTEDRPPGRRAKETSSQSVKKSQKVKSDGFSSTSIINSAFYGAHEEDINCDSKLEGHLVLVGGGDGDPRVRIMRVIRVIPKGIDAVELGRLDGKAEAHTTVQEISILRGHTRAISAIIVDAAGRFIVTASKEENMFLVWDASTFSCEKLFDDIEIGSIHGGMNCLFVCSFKPPYLTMYTVPQERREGWESNAAVTNDGRPEIGMVRTNLWCTASVKGGVAIPSKSMVRATQFLGEKGRSVVEMWQKYHNHKMNEEYRGGSGNAVPSGETVMSKDIRSIKSMTVTDLRGVLNKKPAMSSKNYIPPPNRTTNSSKDPVWGTSDNQQDDNSLGSDDQWGEKAPTGGDSIDAGSVRGSVSADDAEVEEEVDESYEYANKPKKSQYVSSLGGSDNEGEQIEEQYFDNSYNYPDGLAYPVVDRDPFAGKISHKVNMSTISYREADISSLRPNRLKRFDSDGIEVSIAPNRKAHFSDSEESGNEDNNIIIPRRRQYSAEESGSLKGGRNHDNEDLGSNPGYFVPESSYRRRRKPKKGFVKELRDADGSGSEDADY